MRVASQPLLGPLITRGINNYSIVSAVRGPGFAHFIHFGISRAHFSTSLSDHNVKFGGKRLIVGRERRAYATNDNFRDENNQLSEVATKKTHNPTIGDTSEKVDTLARVQEGIILASPPSVLSKEKNVELEKLQRELREICFRTKVDGFNDKIKERISQILKDSGLKKSPTLIYALEANNAELITYLWEQSENYLFNNVKNENFNHLECDVEGNTVVHKAAQYGHERIIERVFSCGVYSVNDCSNNDGATPIHTVVMYNEGSSHIIRKLIGLKIDKNKKAKIYKDKPEVTAVQLAVILGKTNALKVLIKDTTLVGLDGQSTLLHTAIDYEQNDALKELTNIERFSNDDILSGFIYAAKKNKIRALDIMITALRRLDIDINQHDKTGDNALAAAIRAGSYESVYVLLQREKVSTQEHSSEGLGMRELARKQHAEALENEKEKRLRIKHLTENRPNEYQPLNGDDPIRNLVFQGGGPRGIAYVGVWEELIRRKKDREIERVAGTSAGAITATLIALGYTDKDMGKLLKTTKLESFIDHPARANLFAFRKDPTWFNGLKEFIKLCMVGYISMEPGKKDSRPSAIWGTLRNLKGLCEGKVFKEWIEEVIHKKTDSRGYTFGDLSRDIKRGKPYKHLYVVAIDIGSNGKDKGGDEREQSMIVFNSEDERYSNIQIADAVRGSMSIPGVFQPHSINDGSKVLYRCIDGGLLWNYPLEIFDKAKYVESGLVGTDREYPKHNRVTRGFMLTAKEAVSSPRKREEIQKELEQLEKEKPSLLALLRPNRQGVIDFIAKIIKVYANAEFLLGQHKETHNKMRTIEVDDCNVSFLDFDLTPEKMEALITAGKNAGERLFNQTMVNENQKIVQNSSVLPMDIKTSLDKSRSGGWGKKVLAGTAIITIGLGLLGWSLDSDKKRPTIEKEQVFSRIRNWLLSNNNKSDSKSR